MVQVTNALYDARIASESAPLTRVTDIDTEFPAVSTNDSLRVENTTDNGNTVFLSYIELDNADLTTHAVNVADGITGVVAAIETEINTIDALIAAMPDPPTAADLRELVIALRVPAFNVAKGV